MSHIIFHNPPAIGDVVQIYYKSIPEAKPLLLLTFIGDGFTTGFSISGHTFNAGQITIIVNDYSLSVAHWTVKEDRWLDSSNNTSSKNKSVVLLNTESEQYMIKHIPVYSAEFSLSETDHNEHRQVLERRMFLVLGESNRFGFRVDWDIKQVYYTKVAPKQKIL